MVLTKEYQLLDEKYLGNSYGDLYVRLYAKYSEQDLINNKTKVQYQSRAYFSGNYIYDQQGTGNVSGTSATTVTGSCTYPTKGETTIATTEGWVTHNQDGTMSVSASATLNFPNWGWSQIAEGSAELPTIPRNSNLTYVSGKLEEDYPTIIIDSSTQINVRYTKNITNYFDKLDIVAEIEGQTQLIKTITETDGLVEDYIFSFTEEEINAILDFTKNTNLGTTSDGLLNIGYLKFQLSTYTDSTMETQIGSVSTISRVSRIVLLEAMPTLTATLEDVNDTKELTDENTLIRYASIARITPTYSANKGATIKNVTVNNIELGTASYLDIVKSSATSYVIVVTDSRNLSTTFVFQSENAKGDNYFNLINYMPLTIRVDNLERNQPADDKMKLEYSGNYFNGNFSSELANTLEVSYRYKKINTTENNEYSEWIILNPIIDEKIYSQDFVSEAIFDYQSAFDMEIKAVDKLNTVIITNLKLNKGIPIANWDDEKFNVNGRLTVNNQDVTASDTLPIGAIVEYDGDTVPEGYEEYENVLYDNEEGSTENITLNDSAANYKYVEIYGYIKGDGWIGSYLYINQKLFNPNGKTCYLGGMVQTTNSYILWVSAAATIIDNKISIGNNYVQTKTTDTDSNCIYITRVVGYK